MHSPPQLRPFGEELWLAEGESVSFFGFPYPTRMAVLRLADGESLLLWSPVAPTPALRRELDALGVVRELVSPNKLHHLFLGPWRQLLPEARLHAPPGLARRRPALRFDAELGDVPDPAWRGELEQVVVRGSLAMDEVWFFQRRSRTLLVGDLIQRHDPAAVRGFRGWLMRLDGLVGPEGGTPREWRAAFVRRASARAALRRALAWEPERLVIAHGACAARDAGAVVRRSLAWLRPD